jgi:formylglycine-generating enzyme required for sulfatase activity
MLELLLAVATVLGTVFAGVQVWPTIWAAIRRLIDQPLLATLPGTLVTPGNGALKEPGNIFGESRDWQTAKAENTPESLEAFLEQWPSGAHSAAARSCLETATADKVKVAAARVNDVGILSPVTRWSKPGESFSDELARDIRGPEMVVVPDGTYAMGNAGPRRNDGYGENERPAHMVTIARPFAVGKFPITFDEWDIFTATEGTRRIEDQGWGRGRRPVIRVTWDRASQYVAWLSSRTGAKYRLLSEAEWEYCCRARTDTEYSFGDTVAKSQARYERTSTTEVGEFAPNAFGLYDMHGNVWEWCQDHWHDNYSGAPIDGSAWLVAGDRERVMRGGGYGVSAIENNEPKNQPWDLRSRVRHRGQPSKREEDLGFRVARDL